MSDIVVHVALRDDTTETRFIAALDAFAKSRPALAGDMFEDAPEIMVKTVHMGESMRKAVIFQDRQSAADFLKIWRREQHIES